MRRIVLAAAALSFALAGSAEAKPQPDPCCSIWRALDLVRLDRDYLPGTAALHGTIETAGEPFNWYLADAAGTPMPKRAYKCWGNLIYAGRSLFNANIKTKTYKGGRLYHWIIESKSGATRHRYAHPFRMPKALRKDRHYVSRMKTRELPWDQPIADAIAGKPWPPPPEPPPPEPAPPQLPAAGDW
jgi:hypothetical protein